jgi:ABC-2 type transport system ATP-binding protein
MIEVDSLSRRYGQNTAVDDVSFRIGNNEVVGLLGHNGAGKTTIMKMLSGYLEPSAGQIRINDTLLSAGAHEIQKQLGYLPENLPIYPEMMVADYLDYVATMKGIPRGERMRSIRAAITATDLGARALDPIETLSRGLKQRVGVAQAIIGKPRLLILDEPANGLDVHHTDHMRELIRQLAQRATVILSTHIMQEVEAVCDRVLVLRNGRLVLDEPLQSLRHSCSLQLKTCSSAPALPAALARLPQVARVRNAPGGYDFILDLQQDADTDSAANAIARCVIESGARLYQLNPRLRDLGTVFREAMRDASDALTIAPETPDSAGTQTEGVEHGA